MSQSVRERRTALLLTRPPGQLLVHEVYRSVQGESTFAGLPCVFVRLAVCDARCTYCDTPHAFNQGTPRTPEQLLAEVEAFGCPLVEFTGGEPLLQTEVFSLMTTLCDRGYTVLVETSGLVDISPTDRRVHIIMDLKCPGSGESENNRWENLNHLKPTDQIKFVVSDRADFDWAVEAIRRYDLCGRFSVLISPVFGRVTPRQLADWLLASGTNARMQLQMHKYIWDPAARGV